MALQMIFCVETNKSAATDWVYINELLRHKYVISNNLKITPIFMGSKTKYAAKDVLKQIEKCIRQYTFGESKVVYCIDTDDFERDYMQQKDFDNVNLFCAQRKFDMIWFCHDVEEVFQGRKISDSKKVHEAGMFRKNKNIENLQYKKLSSEKMVKGTSNILNILDKYLVRKLEADEKD